MANRALRAPMYSARGLRPLGAEAAGWSGSVFVPIWESSPASRETCYPVRSADDEPTVTPRSPASVCNWP